MKKILSIIRYEFITTVTRRSYLIMLFLIPLSGLVMLNVRGWFSQRAEAERTATTSSEVTNAKPSAIIDESGFLKGLPTEYQQDFVMTANEFAAKELYQKGEIKSYFIIPDDFLQSGRVIQVQAQINLLGEDTTQQRFSTLITAALTGYDPVLFARLQNPLQVSIRTLNPASQQNSPTSMWVPYIVAIIFYITILGASGLLLSSITNEKKNRVLEVLLSSLTPTQLFTGKIIALGAAGLLQTLVWAGSGITIMRLVNQQPNLGTSLTIPPYIVVWAACFFILGYTLYGSLMAGLGAMAPNLREATQSTMLVIFPLIVPLMFSSSVAATPNAPIFLVLSLFPFTAPITMLSRISATNVPIWQILLSLGLLATTCIFIVRAVSRLFRAQILLAGNPFKAREYLKALISQDYAK